MVLQPRPHQRRHEHRDEQGHGVRHDQPPETARHLLPGTCKSRHALWREAGRSQIAAQHQNTCTAMRPWLESQASKRGASGSAMSDMGP